MVFFGKETVYANKRATDAVMAIATVKTIEAKAAETAKAAAALLPPPLPMPATKAHKFAFLSKCHELRIRYDCRTFGKTH